MTKSASSLATAQNLYILQTNLWNVLDAKNLTPAERNKAKKQLREFASLLRNADWRVMGGEDVYTALRQMQADVARKLKGRGSISKKPSIRSRATVQKRAKRK